MPDNNPPLTCPGCGALLRNEKNVRFCHDCGAPLNARDTLSGAEEKPTPVPDAPPDGILAADNGRDTGHIESAIRLEVQLPESLEESHWCFPFRLTNLDERVITRISLSVASTLFDGCSAPITDEWSTHLQKGASTETDYCEFNVPDRSGLYPVRIEGLYFDTKGNPNAFRGFFKVYFLRQQPGSGEKEAPPGDIRIEVKDGGVFSGKSIAAAAQSGAAIRIQVKGGGVLDLDQLGRQPAGGSTDAPAGTALQWVSVPLERDPDQTRMLREWLNRKQRPDSSIVVHPDGRRRAPAKAILSVRGAGDPRTIHIWTGRRCRLGRDPAAADLVAVLLPCNAENDQKSAFVSARHCRLTIEKNRVLVDDNDSTNGTFINGRRIKTRGEINDGQVISMANVVSFRYREFRRPDKTRQGRRLLASCRTISACSQALSGTGFQRAKRKAPLEAFRLKRLDGFKDRIEYLFLQLSATIGSAPDAAIRIAHAAVSDYHARIRRIKGRFFIEDLNSISGTRVDGKLLVPYELESLADKSTVGIGQVDLILHIAEVSQ